MSIERFSKGDILDDDDMLEVVKGVFESMSGDEIADIINKYSHFTVEYEGDGMWNVTGI